MWSVKAQEPTDNVDAFIVIAVDAMHSSAVHSLVSPVLREVAFGVSDSVATRRRRSSRWG